MTNHKNPSAFRPLATSAHQARSFLSRVAAPACFVVFAALLTPDVAAVQADLQFPHALTPAFRWSEPMEMRLSGVPIVVRRFVAAQPLEQVARSMARHQDRFQRVTTLPGSILLSGVHGGRHWVAQLDAMPGRVQGMVSALPMDFDAPQARGEEIMGFLAPWLTQNARFVFGHSSREQGHGVVQTVHVPHGSPGEFMGALDRRLAGSGWQRSGLHSWALASPMGLANGRRIDAFPIHDPVAGAAIFINQSH